MIRSWVAFSLIFACVSFISPAKGADTFSLAHHCRSDQGRAEGLANTMKIYEDLKLKIEAVPPETNAYLVNENAAIFGGNQDAQSEGRFRLLQANPYYFAWQLRSALDMLDDLKKVTSPSTVGLSHGQREIMQYVRMLSAAAEVRSTFDEYDRMDATRNPPVLSKKDRSKFYFSLVSGMGQFQTLAECAVLYGQLLEP